MKDLKVAARQLANKMNIRESKSEVYLRHQALDEAYKQHPQSAMIVDSAVVEGGNFEDPFRTSVSMNPELSIPLKTGLHRAVGGDHDFPNPGDLLCAALATCFENTMRMIANRLEIRLMHSKVAVSARVDVRGTLMFDRTVPTGFQSMHMDIEIGAEDVTEKLLSTVIGAAKRSCVVYQTLKPNLPISTSVEIVQDFVRAEPSLDALAVN